MREKYWSLFSQGGSKSFIPKYPNPPKAPPKPEKPPKNLVQPDAKSSNKKSG